MWQCPKFSAHPCREGLIRFSNTNTTHFTSSDRLQVGGAGPKKISKRANEPDGPPDICRNCSNRAFLAKKLISAQPMRDEEKFGSVEFFIEKRHLIYQNDLEPNMAHNWCDYVHLFHRFCAGQNLRERRRPIKIVFLRGTVPYTYRNC